MIRTFERYYYQVRSDRLEVATCHQSVDHLDGAGLSQLVEYYMIRISHACHHANATRRKER